MSVARQANILGQQRYDVPHIRALDSSVANDFDVLAGKIIAGGQALVVSGWTPVAFSTSSPASNLQLNVAGSLLLHPEASENGTIFAVPANRAPETLNASNTRVRGSFSASTTNFVGIDLLRTPDPTTADLVQFIDPDTKLEKPKEVPLGRTLDYVIYISVQDFGSTPGVAPLLKVVTDSFNNIVSVEDARNSFFRLGSGGAIPDPTYTYPWPGGRGEIGDNSDFSVGDKVITSFKDWYDAVMTRMWELGGGEHWYSPTADRNVHMVRSGAPFVSNGDWFTWDGSNLNWQGLVFVFDNSTGHFNVIADQTSSLPGLTDLADGECLYVDIDRSQNRTSGNPLQPVKAALATLSTPTVPGSRYVLAWRYGSGSTAIVTRDAQFPVNASFTVATTSATGVVKLHQTATTPSSPIVLSDGDLGTANGVLNLNANKQAILTSTSGTAGIFTGASGSYGLQGIGVGAGGGLYGTGGGTDGVGVQGLGGATNGIGVIGTGTGTGAGGSFTSAGSGGIGVIGIGSAGGNGVKGTGGGNAAGVAGIGGGTADTAAGVYGIGQGAGTGIGVYGVGTGTGNGVKGLGGPSGGTGGNFTGTGSSSGVQAQGAVGVFAIASGSNGIGVVALGSTGGDGIQTNGNGAGAGIKATGAATAGSAAIRVVADATHTLSRGISCLDPLGTGVFYETDSVGAPGGWYNAIREMWKPGADSTHTSGFDWLFGGSNNTQFVTFSGAGYGQQVLGIGPTASGSSTATLTYNSKWVMQASTIAVMEWDIFAGASSSTSQTINYMGFIGTPGNGVTFSRSTFGVANWFVNGVDTGVNTFPLSSTATPVRFRIELFGSSRIAGGTETAKCYINNVLVATLTSGLPVVNATFIPGFQTASGASSTTVLLYIGHVNASCTT